MLRQSICWMFFLSVVQVFFGCSTISHWNVGEKFVPESDHYIALLNFDLEGNIKGFSTGIAVSDHAAVACLHSLFLSMSLSTRNAYGQIIQGNQVFCERKNDLLVMDFGVNAFIPPAVKFALPQVGEELYAYSNAYGMEKLFFRVMVAKVLQDNFFFTPAIPPGGSGSALYNENGEIVGMVQGIHRIPGDPEIGVALHAFHIERAVERSKKTRMVYF